MPVSRSLVRLGECISLARRRRHLTQSDLARQLGVDAQTIARYEKGETAISGPADHLIRFIFAWSQLPDREKLDVIERVRALIDADEPVNAPPAPPLAESFMASRMSSIKPWLRFFRAAICC